MRLLTACAIMLALCGAAPVAAEGKPPQEYRILTSATGDFPPIEWLDYWNAAFVGYGGTYNEAFTAARNAAAKGGWETANIAPEAPAPITNGPLWVVLMIHTAPPGGDPPPINGSMDAA